MAEPTSHSKQEGNHDDCDDCKREKQQNEGLIRVYERLQQVNQKAKRVKQAMMKHHREASLSASLYADFERKIQEVPLIRQHAESHEISKFGLAVAADLIERSIKSKQKEQNERLKAIIAKIEGSQRTKSRMNNCETVLLRYSHQFDENNSMELSSQVFKRELKLQSTANSLIDSRSTQYYTPRTVDYRKYDDLNLWLYDNESNTKLQQQLYMTEKAVEKSRQRRSGVLPAIRKAK